MIYYTTLDRFANELKSHFEIKENKIFAKQGHEKQAKEVLKKMESSLSLTQIAFGKNEPQAINYGIQENGLAKFGNRMHEIDMIVSRYTYISWMVQGIDETKRHQNLEEAFNRAHEKQAKIAQIKQEKQKAEEEKRIQLENEERKRIESIGLDEKERNNIIKILPELCKIINVNKNGELVTKKGISGNEVTAIDQKLKIALGYATNSSNTIVVPFQFIPNFKTKEWTLKSCKYTKGRIAEIAQMIQQEAEKTNTSTDKQQNKSFVSYLKKLWGKNR